MKGQAMRMTRTPRYRWLPVPIDDFEKWQTGLLEESARRLGAGLDPYRRVQRWGFVGSPVTFRGQTDRQSAEEAQPLIGYRTLA
jgi:hypothetical protein